VDFVKRKLVDIKYSFVAVRLFEGSMFFFDRQRHSSSLRASLIRFYGYQTPAITQKLQCPFPLTAAIIDRFASGSPSTGACTSAWRFRFSVGSSGISGAEVYSTLSAPCE